jgi:integrase
MQAAVPETAARVRQRLEAIFDDAEFRGMCSGNPARAIRRKLRETKRGRDRGQFAALPYVEAPAFMRELRQREGIAARALEFAVLTAARTGEVIGATWDEIDLQAGAFTVLGRRMKGGEQHVVHLVPRAVEILQAQAALGSAYVFPSAESVGKETAAPMSNMAMLALLRRMDADKRTTVHGLCRATFSTWAYETAAARPDVIEACLAHREGDRVKAAYNRARFNAERRALLQAWADFLDGTRAAANEEQAEQLAVAA